MANLTETSAFEAGIYQLETTDPVVGGAGGVSNRQAQQLANRTKWLKDHVDALETAAAGFATTAEVQAEIAKLDFKQSVRAATTANITLSGPQSIDGVNVNVGDRVLVKNQSSAVQNGIYVVATSAWSRAADADGSPEVTAGMVVVVAEGTSQADTIWKLTTNDPITLDTTALAFADITSGYAPLNSPAFTGSPTAPTPAAGDNDTSVATTAFAVNLVDGLVSVDVSGSADKTLTAAQGGTGIIELTGALTGSINLNLPAGTGTYLLANKTSGAYNITARMTGGGGSSVVIPQGSAIIVYSDGTNVKAASSAGQSFLSVQNHTPAAGVTSLTVLGGYTPGALIVAKNGAVLNSDDFTAAASPDITLSAAAVAGDEFTTYAFTAFQVADALKKSGDTATGPITLPGNASTALQAVPKQQAESIAASAVLNRLQYSLTASIATASGSAVDFTSIPSWAKRITLVSNGVSTNGTGVVQVQALTSGGAQTSGYEGSYVCAVGAAASYGANISTSFALSANVVATDARYGMAVFSLVPGTNKWIQSGTVGTTAGPNVSSSGGSVTLSSALTGLRVLTPDTFDGGSLHLLIEG